MAGWVDECSNPLHCWCFGVMWTAYPYWRLLGVQEWNINWQWCNMQTVVKQSTWKDNAATKVPMRAHESSVTCKYQGENMNLSNHPDNLFILISPKKIVEKVSFSSVNVCCVICPLGSALCIKWMVKVPLSAFKFNWTRYDTDIFYVKARFNYWKFPLRKSKFILEMAIT